MASANDILTEEIEQKKALIVKYRGIDKELLEYREENENYVTKVIIELCTVYLIEVLFM